MQGVAISAYQVILMVGMPAVPLDLRGQMGRDGVQVREVRAQDSGDERVPVGATSQAARVRRVPARGRRGGGDPGRTGGAGRAAGVGLGQGGARPRAHGHEGEHQSTGEIGVAG
ncbi:unnamed protein product [Leptidea sinapis]|uniref:Uncharacterized protein n=1 Tax=Leptidea sinapis TaxID=189913 RepID=A0A5E4QT06_9NEOP|nr:unnamed protein product [Leptidea sinapis]